MRDGTMNIEVSQEIFTICPQFVGAMVEAQVVNSSRSEMLWQEVERMAKHFRSTLTVNSLKEVSGIAATREVYRACGKDPSRYRPSAEALIRRLLQGKSLYQVDTLVDLINVASMAYGYSIGGFDADRIVGHRLVLGVGREGEPYEGIGRGIINIAGLPVYRDAEGGIGTPTSDHERTKITLSTTRLLVLINGYDGREEQVRATAERVQQLLRSYASSDGGVVTLYP